MGSMRLLFVELSCLQAKIANVHGEIDPMTSKYRSRLSIFELSQDTPRIHPWYICLGPMQLIFVELSCLQAKCRRLDGRTNGRTDRRTDTWTRQSNSRVGYTQPAQKANKNCIDI